MTLGFNPYSVLGVPRDATDKQIRQARHELVRKYHPDVNHSPNAAARFEEIQEAFELLSDPEARAKYDRTHDEAGRIRLVQSPDGGYHPDSGDQPNGAAPPSLSVSPTSVDFGVLQLHTSWDKFAAVHVDWTGRPPPDIIPGLPGKWWSVRTRGALGSRCTFILRPKKSRKMAVGHYRDEFTLTVDGTVFTITLATVVDNSVPKPASRYRLRDVIGAWLLVAFFVGIFIMIAVMAAHTPK